MDSEQPFGSVLRKDSSEDPFENHGFNAIEELPKSISEESILGASEDPFGRPSQEGHMSLPSKLEPYKNPATVLSGGPDIGIRTILFLQKYSLSIPFVAIFPSVTELSIGGS